MLTADIARSSFAVIRASGFRLPRTNTGLFQLPLHRRRVSCSLTLPFKCGTMYILQFELEPLADSIRPFD